jgi:magnesium transporter
MTLTRLYRGGVLERENFPVSEVSELTADPTVTVWLDIERPGAQDLADIAQELALHPLAVEDAVHVHQRPKLDRYASHLFLAAYAFDSHALTQGTHEIVPIEVCAFVTQRVLVTVRKAPGFPLKSLLERWDAKPRLAADGPAFLLWGLLDVIVDTHFDATQRLDEDIDRLEEAVLAARPDIHGVQRSIFRLRKAIMRLRRYAAPLREVAAGLARADSPMIGQALSPYFEDVYDHVLRVADWTDSLRGLLDTVVDTNLTNQGNRMNLVMKKVTSWAAIIAVPTLVTGYFGQNLAFPLINTTAGWWLSNVFLVVFSLVLYLQFKHRDWL